MNLVDNKETTIFGLSTLGKTCRALALVSLAGLVLAGCSSSEAEEAGGSDDASASASVTSASESSEGGETEAAESEEYYSGGSKALAGEYRAADEQGPAQNVPRPQEPEGMNIESTEGMVKFLNYWNDERNYAVQTGDVSQLYRMVETHYESEISFYNSLKDTYENGGWYITANDKQREIMPQPDMVISHGNGLYSIPANFKTPSAAVVDPQTKEVATLDTREANLDGYEIVLRFQEGKWSIADVEVIN